jgi:hypothetical protein
MASRRWLIGALGLFMLSLVIWATAALLLNTASAGTVPFSFSIRSLLKADYSSDGASEPLGAFRISVVNDAFRDSGLSPEEAETLANAVKLAMSSLVPTATARNFEGAAPFTATPTNTPIPTDTPTPTPTLVPTSTATKTLAPTATKKIKPSDTPAPADGQSPSRLSGWTVSPTFGTLTTCSITVDVQNLHVYDPAYSSGIEFIKLKYYDPVQDKYFYSTPLYPSSPPGWKTGDEWDDYYNLSVDITISPACSSSFLPDSDGLMVSFSTSPLLTTCDYTVPVYVWIEDNAGNTVKPKLGEYEFPDDCGTSTP